MIRPPSRLDASANASPEIKKLVAWLNQMQEFVTAITPIDSPSSSPSITTKGTYHRVNIENLGGSNTSDLPAWL
jgi:hypothetical protein